jgi:hypothetical protein
MPCVVRAAASGDPAIGAAGSAVGLGAVSGGPTTTFPVGYYELHPDRALNFQLNRFWNWVGDPVMLDDLRRIAPELTTYDAWVEQLLALGTQALDQGRTLAGAYLIRTGEFFMSAGDTRQDSARADLRGDCSRRAPSD